MIYCHLILDLLIEFQNLIFQESLGDWEPLGSRAQHWLHVLHSPGK